MMEHEILPGKIKAVLFDLDGTLMETDDHMVHKVAGVLRWLRFRNPELWARRIVMKAETPVNGLITFFDRLGMDQAIMVLFRRKRQKAMPSGKPGIRLTHPIMAGAVEMIEILSRTYRLGLVTTNSKEEAEAFLEENGIRDYFGVVVARSSVTRLKPHPEPILFAAARLEVTPDECLMVGDTTPDMRSAVAAGAFPVGVLCGFGTREELQKAGARMILDRTSQVAETLFLSI
jgi:phosphoglycolate phosphatase